MLSKVKPIWPLLSCSCSSKPELTTIVGAHSVVRWPPCWQLPTLLPLLFFTCLALLSEDEKWIQVLWTHTCLISEKNRTGLSCYSFKWKLSFIMWKLSILGLCAEDATISFKKWHIWILLAVRLSLAPSAWQGCLCCEILTTMTIIAHHKHYKYTRTRTTIATTMITMTTSITTAK